MKLIAIWAVLLVFGFLGLVAYNMEPPPPPTTQQKQAQSSQNNETENRRAGCQKLMVVVTERLEAFSQSCPETLIARMANEKDASKCVVAGGVLYNQSHGKLDLAALSQDTTRSIAIACLMIVHGLNEETAEYAVKKS